MPATATITLHANLFTLPPLPLLSGCSGVPTIPQVHYYHNDVAVYARFCYSLGGGFRSTLGGSCARRFTRARRVCSGRVHCRCSRSSIPDTIRYNPATAKAGGCTSNSSLIKLVPFAIWALEIVTSSLHEEWDSFADSNDKDRAILGTKHKDDFEPYWQDEKDWLCIVEFLPTDNPEAPLFSLRP